jgi:hypothetical protein
VADELAALFFLRLSARKGLLRDELVGVEEYQSAGIEDHRPPPGRVGEMVHPDVDGLRRHFAEILNDDTSAFSVGAGINANAGVHRQCAAISDLIFCGLGSHCFPPGNR